MPTDVTSAMHNAAATTPDDTQQRSQAVHTPTDASDSTTESAALRQLVSTLCWFACGHDKQLDEQFGIIVRLMNRAASAEELNTALNTVTALIGAQPARKPASASQSVSTPDNAALLRLLDRLALIPAISQQISAFRRKIADADTNDSQVNAEQAGLVIVQYCNALEAERANLISMLDQMTSSIGELSGHLSGDARLRAEARDQSIALNQQLVGKVNTLGSNVYQANDLKALQSEVHKGLELINSGLQEAREREEARLRAFEARADEMKTRIDRLENETQQLRESVAVEHQNACTDRLTSLPNRMAYELRIKQDLQHSRDSGEPLVLLIWDIDRFKSVNDTYGHHAGDRALQVVGQRLAQHARESDFCARFGGEEFSMTLRNLPVQQAAVAADRIRQSIERIKFHFREKPVTLTVSCGLTLIREDDTPERAFERADAALYEAKNAGRNRCMVG